MDCGLFGVRFLFLGHKNGAATPVDYSSTFATASPPAAGRFWNKKWLKAESPALSHLKSKQLFYKLCSRYFSANPSRNAFPATSPMTRYLLCTGSKMMGCSRSGSIFPSSPMILSSALTLMISPTNLQVSGS